MYGQSAVYTGSYTLHSIAVACDSKLKDKKKYYRIYVRSVIWCLCVNQLYDNDNWIITNPFSYFVNNFFNDLKVSKM